MRKDFIVLFFLLSSIISFGQNDQENKILELVNKLNWSSVKTENDLTLLLTASDSISNNLVQIGEPATEFLLKAIKIQEKTIASHAILTRIYDAEYKKIKLTKKYIHKNCQELIGWHNIYNGISWEWFPEKGQIISQNQIDLASNYWNKRIILKENISLQNNEEISKTLEEEDKIKYPCTNKKSNDYTGLSKMIIRKKNGEENSRGNQDVTNSGSGTGNGGDSPGSGSTYSRRSSTQNYFTLAGRRVTNIPTIDNDCNQAGRVIIEVTVDKSGKTISAINAKGSTADGCLIALAKKYALQTKWQPSETAAEKQVGTITYNFTF